MHPDKLYFSFPQNSTIITSSFCSAGMVGQRSPNNLLICLKPRKVKQFLLGHNVRY